MNATTNGTQVFVTLSRRNLLHLLAVLDDPGVLNKSLVRRTEDGVHLTVVAEQDHIHYDERQPGPGYRAA
jgi:hypothetical protein